MLHNTWPSAQRAKNPPTGKTPPWASRLQPLLSECDVDRSFACEDRKSIRWRGRGAGLG